MSAKKETASHDDVNFPSRNVIGRSSSRQPSRTPKKVQRATSTSILEKYTKMLKKEEEMQEKKERTRRLREKFDLKFSEKQNGANSINNNNNNTNISNNNSRSSNNNNRNSLPSPNFENFYNMSPRTHRQNILISRNKLHTRTWSSIETQQQFNIYSHNNLNGSHLDQANNRNNNSKKRVEMSSGYHRKMSDPANSGNRKMSDPANSSHRKMSEPANSSHRRMSDSANSSHRRMSDPATNAKKHVNGSKAVSPVPENDIVSPETQYVPTESIVSKTSDVPQVTRNKGFIEDKTRPFDLENDTDEIEFDERLNIKRMIPLNGINVPDRMKKAERKRKERLMKLKALDEDCIRAQKIITKLRLVEKRRLNSRKN